jgi:hypothetical protein
MSDRPAACTDSVEERLDAILVELRALNSRLGQAPTPASGDAFAIEEPAPARREGGDR